MFKSTALLALALSLSLAACSRNMSSNTYTDSASGGVAVEGVVVSARPITIKSADKLQDNGLGMVAGGVAGGVAGNTVGGGSGRTLATVGGVLAGAAIGALVQDQLGTSEGMEYIVQVNKENTGGTTQKKEVNMPRGKKASDVSVETNFKSELVTVVQGNDVLFNAGQPVFVIYSDDRPRIISRQQ